MDLGACWAGIEGLGVAVGLYNINRMEDLLN